MYGNASSGGARETQLSAQPARDKLGNRGLAPDIEMVAIDDDLDDLEGKTSRTAGLWPAAGGTLAVRRLALA